MEGKEKAIKSTLNLLLQRIVSRSRKKIVRENLSKLQSTVVAPAMPALNVPWSQ